MASADEKNVASPQDATHGADDISPVSSTHLDDNYELYKSIRDDEIDPAEAKRVLRKIDQRIMPILFITYMLQYLDKNTINFASVYGLQKGTGETGNDYSWLGTYISFLLLRRNQTLTFQRLYFLLWVPVLPIPFRIPSSTIKDWKIPIYRNYHLGHNSHHDTSMYQLCRHCSESFYAWRSGSNCQPRICSDDVNVVHLSRAAIAT